MSRRPGSASDPLWFKDAIIYELHVKAFADGNADGIGDFQGLVGKLDYLQALGVTCIWLLPFFPSPLRDDGYDIAGYTGVHPSYGTMEDFKAFLSAAHERDLQVMIELVINHTSDQHPWFQAARTAPPGSPEREFYVWSNSDEKYKDARIIFTDTEKSNWTWDPVAKAYFWHRFFSHQPDLNYDNPAVLSEVLTIMRFWLDLGVDGLRLDAIPYLVERDGTNCENLPETHVLIKQIRAAMDADYSNRVILAEANQWPSDVRPYFGNGDECHMAFHFPVMPRIYMALRQEDRLPITDIMSQTPEIPENCQWGLFLRNHDELTLEMVTSDERDYMYLAYSADPRTRINLGIRRRLGPLMDNSRRRIELLNSLLFSLPGTPIIYYGDEIGMGDNVYLGDRNGVRTPMQWNSDRNAGFSRSNPAMLYSPIIMDPVWGYQSLNVEAQEGDPSSLLNWMRNMIALRKLFRVFGRGSVRFLSPPNRKILAYLRSLDGEQVLCVMNLSRYAQPVDLDLSDLAGMTPIEMLGYVEFPVIGADLYRLTLGPYGFLWLELHGVAKGVQPEPETPIEAPLLAKRSWKELIPLLEQSALAEHLRKQRWFAGKARQIRDILVFDWVDLDSSAILFLRVLYQSGEPEEYFVPVVIREGALHDALADDFFCRSLLTLRKLSTHHGVIAGHLDSGAEYDSQLPVQRGTAEQSNSSVMFDEKLILKVFRRLNEGINPEVEIGSHFAMEAAFARVPPFMGWIEYTRQGGGTYSIAILQGIVENEGDGWNWTAEELDRYYEAAARSSLPQSAEAERDSVGAYLEAARTLGRRTGEMHVALSGAINGSSFVPEPLTTGDIEVTAGRIRAEATQSLDLLKTTLPTLPDDTLELAGQVLLKRRQLIDRLTFPADMDYGKRIRLHGDYHLGQVLRTKNDFVIVDFEGEPSRPLEQRRDKHSPLKDVAGMLRSFSYAANAALMNYTARHPETFAGLLPWARIWEENVRSAFLSAYREVPGIEAILPRGEGSFERLLAAYRFEKAMYELSYELGNRPSWVRIPLAGILSLATS